MRPDVGDNVEFQSSIEVFYSELFKFDRVEVKYSNSNNCI